jgi:hypothetical protein
MIGGVAQLGERLPCTQEVIGSIPFTSTKHLFRAPRPVSVGFGAGSNSWQKFFDL